MDLKDIDIYRSNPIIEALLKDFLSAYIINIEKDKIYPLSKTNNNEALCFDDGYSIFGQLSYYSKKLLNEYKKGFEIYSNAEDLINSLSNNDKIEYVYQIENDSNLYNISIRVLKRNNNIPELCLLAFSIVDDKMIDSSKLIETIKRQNLELEKKHEELEATAKRAYDANKAKSTFLFNMSHDIRTPMNAIVGFSEIARKNINDKNKVLDSLEKVKSASDHLLLLINEILDMARIENGKTTINLVSMDLLTEITTLKSLLGDSLQKKDLLFLYEFINVKNTKVFADKLHITQILLNVLSNSVKYTNPGGKITFSINQLEDLGTSGKYRFMISDTGIGMSEDFLKIMFEQFTREKTTGDVHRQGTGLGMSITKALIELLGGTIKVESELNVGTTTTIDFEFKYSFSDDNIEKINNEYYELSGKRILLAEDNALNKEIAIDMLVEKGIKVYPVSDGKECIDALISNMPGYFDAVLMDVQMPIINGYEATKIIRALENKTISKIPIIAMTANAFQSDKEDALNSGMNDHIAKPVDENLLFDTLLNYIG